ncbi:MAG: hypothetical protein ABIH22_00015 [Candidatus Margulisiibacteriota bacterium]
MKYNLAGGTLGTRISPLSSQNKGTFKLAVVNQPHSTVASELLVGCARRHINYFETPLFMAQLAYDIGNRLNNYRDNGKYDVDVASHKSPGSVGRIVVWEHGEGNNNSHVATYWYDVFLSGSGRIDFEPVKLRLAKSDKGMDPDAPEFNKIAAPVSSKIEAAIKDFKVERLQVCSVSENNGLIRLEAADGRVVELAVTSDEHGVRQVNVPAKYFLVSHEERQKNIRLVMDYIRRNFSPHSSQAELVRSGFTFKLNVGEQHFFGDRQARMFFEQNDYAVFYDEKSKAIDVYIKDPFCDEIKNRIRALVVSLTGDQIKDLPMAERWSTENAIPQLYYLVNPLLTRALNTDKVDYSRMEGVKEVAEWFYDVSIMVIGKRGDRHEVKQTGPGEYEIVVESLKIDKMRENIYGQERNDFIEFLRRNIPEMKGLEDATIVAEASSFLGEFSDSSGGFFASPLTEVIGSSAAGPGGYLYGYTGLFSNKSPKNGAYRLMVFDGRQIESDNITLNSRADENRYGHYIIGHAATPQEAVLATITFEGAAEILQKFINSVHEIIGPSAQHRFSAGRYELMLLSVLMGRDPYEQDQDINEAIKSAAQKLLSDFDLFKATA